MRHKVDRLVHADEFGCEEKERGGFELTAPLLLGEAFHKVGDVDRHEVNDFRRCVFGKGGEECLDVGFVALGQDDHDFVDAVVVPTGEEFIYGTMEGLPAPRAGTGVRRSVRLGKAVMEGRRHHQLQATGQIEGADGKDQARIMSEQATDFGPGKAAQPQ
jgi:hypothetical protein